MLPNFRKIGEYRSIDDGPEYISYIGRTKSRIFPIVYLFVVDDIIVYIGESRRGYSRPLSYHKNMVMNRQREGIFSAIQSGRVVEVFAIEVPNISLEFNSEMLSCYLAQDYEKLLISKYQPKWNGRN